MRRISILFLIFSLASISSFSQQVLVPKAMLNQTSVDFGQAHRGERLQKTVELTNEGGAELVIQGMRMSMPGLTIKAQQKIPPGVKAVLTIEINTAAITGDINGNIVLVTNDPQNPEMKIDIKGSVRSLIEILPQPMIFLSAFRWEAAAKQAGITIVNRSAEPLKIINVQTEGDQFTPSIQSVEEGKRYQLSVKLHGDAPAGKAIGRITVKTNGETLQIPVYTFMMEKVYMNPGYVDFGTLDLDLLKEDPEQLSYRKISVFLYQYHGENFQIQVKSCPQFLSLEKIPARQKASVIEIPGQGKTSVFELAVSPVLKNLKKGKFENEIVLTTNDKEFPLIKIPVSGEVS